MSASASASRTDLAITKSNQVQDEEEGGPQLISKLEVILQN